MEAITVPGTVDSLDEIAKYVMAAAAEAGVEKKIAYNLRLAVDEVATNIMLHGYEESGLEGTVEVWAKIDDDSLTICIEDSAIPFDPFKSDPVAEEQLKLPLEQRKIGGLGVHLAIRSVDKFIYERVNDRNRNIFVVNRHKG